MSVRLSPPPPISRLVLGSTQQQQPPRDAVTDEKEPRHEDNNNINSSSNAKTGNHFTSDIVRHDISLLLSIKQSQVADLEEKVGSLQRDLQDSDQLRLRWMERCGLLEAKLVEEAQINTKKLAEAQESARRAQSELDFHLRRTAEMFRQETLQEATLAGPMPGDLRVETGILLTSVQRRREELQKQIEHDEEKRRKFLEQEEENRKNNNSNNTTVATSISPMRRKIMHQEPSVRGPTSSPLRFNQQQQRRQEQQPQQQQQQVFNVRRSSSPQPISPAHIPRFPSPPRIVPQQAQQPPPPQALIEEDHAGCFVTAIPTATAADIPQRSSPGFAGLFQQQQQQNQHQSRFISPPTRGRDEVAQLEAQNKAMQQLMQLQEGSNNNNQRRFTAVTCESDTQTEEAVKLQSAAIGLQVGPAYFLDTAVFYEMSSQTEVLSAKSMALQTDDPRVQSRAVQVDRNDTEADAQLERIKAAIAQLRAEDAYRERRSKGEDISDDEAGKNNNNNNSTELREMQSQLASLLELQMRSLQQQPTVVLTPPQQQQNSSNAFGSPPSSFWQRALKHEGPEAPAAAQSSKSDQFYVRNKYQQQQRHQEPAGESVFESSAGAAVVAAAADGEDGEATSQRECEAAEAAAILRHKQRQMQQQQFISPMVKQAQAEVIELRATVAVLKKELLEVKRQNFEYRERMRQFDQANAMRL